MKITKKNLQRIIREELDFDQEVDRVAEAQGNRKVSSHTTGDNMGIKCPVCTRPTRSILYVLQGYTTCTKCTSLFSPDGKDLSASDPVPDNVEKAWMAMDF